MSDERISFDEFKRIEMKIGEITAAQRVPETDKLLKLSVNVGEENPRQIISGIAEYVSEPDELVGRRVAFVTNLQPRTIRGLESNGMILAVQDEEGRFSLLAPDQRIAVGTPLS